MTVIPAESSWKCGCRELNRSRFAGAALQDRTSGADHFHHRPRRPADGGGRHEKMPIRFLAKPIDDKLLIAAVEDSIVTESEQGHILP